MRLKGIVAAASVPVAIGAAVATALLHLWSSRDSWRHAFCVEVEERMEDWLRDAERELFRRHPRHKTRARIHESFADVCGWGYMGDLDAWLDHAWHAKLQLEADVVQDPKGALAYHEARRVIEDAIGYVTDVMPTETLLDRLFGGLWEPIEPGRLSKFEKLPDECYELDDMTVAHIMADEWPRTDACV